jgi:hypothetical protein
MNKIWDKMAAAINMNQQPPTDYMHAGAEAFNPNMPLQQPVTSSNTPIAMPSRLGMPIASTAVMKEVLLLTPVLLTRDDLLGTHQPKKQLYQHGHQLAQLPPLPALHKRHDGFIFDMPLVDVANYLRAEMHNLRLDADEVLVDYLDRVLGGNDKLS